MFEEYPTKSAGGAVTRFAYRDGLRLIAQQDDCERVEGGGRVEEYGEEW